MDEEVVEEKKEYGITQIREYIKKEGEFVNEVYFNNWRWNGGL